MEMSTFGTQLKIAMKNRFEYQTYNGKKKLIKRYTQTDLANDIGYTVDAIKGWTKKNGGLPNMKMLKRIADLLNVDTAYLLGEQKCQRNAEQTICDVTNLNEYSAQLLSNLNDIEADTMNELLNHKDFERLILCIYEYTHSQNNKVTITNTLDNTEQIPYAPDAQKDIMKYRATETFSNILEDLYKLHLQDAIEAKIGSEISKMMIEINEYYELKSEPKVYISLIRLISSHQKTIMELDANNAFCKYEPDSIIENFEQIGGKEWLKKNNKSLPSV